LFFFVIKSLKIKITGAIVVVATGANSVADGLAEGKRDDDDGKPADVGAAIAAGVAPNEIGAAAVVVVVPPPPKGAAADGPPPNENEEVVVVGTEATVAEGVAPNANVEG
jgi:hypothetical protein